jgi:hypothetical protein
LLPAAAPCRGCRLCSRCAGVVVAPGRATILARVSASERTIPVFPVRSGHSFVAAATLAPALVTNAVEVDEFRKRFFLQGIERAIGYAVRVQLR